MRALIAGSGPFLVAVLACVAWGQPGDAPSRADESPAAATDDAADDAPTKPAIEASPLDTFLLRDSKGNLVPVLGMSFEEFERLLKIKRGLAAPAPPEYSLDVLAVTGAATDTVANLQVTATVRVRQSDWVRIPLRLNQAILKNAAEHTGAGEFFITCEPNGDGYLCWLKEGEQKDAAEPPQDDKKSGAAKANSHQIKLQFAVPLEAVGDERRLDLAMPQATESSLKIEVPLDKVETSQRNADDGFLTSRPLAGGKSEVSLLGASGDVQLSWRPSRESPSTRSALEAAGEVLVKVEGRARVSSEVKLRVRSHAGPLESFQVRLPPGMELNPGSPTGYTVAVATSANMNSDGRQVVEVKLDRVATGPVDVRLSASLASQPRGNPSVEPANWEVVGAARQRGTVDVTVDGDWLLQWTDDPSVRRVDAPVDSAAMDKLAARFEYFRQPCRLKLQVSPRPTRVSVDPTYVIYVEADQTRLAGKLRYRIRGTRAQNITIDSAGWELDRIAPDSYFASDAIETRAEGPWQMALAADAPAEMELELDAHQASPASDSVLQIGLPRPQADLITPATVVVVPGDNVELIPDATGTRGLTPEALPPGLMLPARQQPPLVYRDVGGIERAQFAARFRLRQRKTAVSTETLVQLDRRRMQVTQKLLYRIAYEPQRVFELAIPAELQRASGLSVAYGDEVLPLEPVDAEVAQPSASAYRFVAPSDLIGACEFTVKYALPTPMLPPGEATSVSIPLPMPVDRDESEFSNHSLAVRYADDLKVDSVKPPSDARSGPAEFDGPQETQLALLHPVGYVDVAVSTVDTQDSAAVAIQRAWIQSWVSQSSRQDRAVWRLTPRESTVRLRLPPGSNVSGVQVALNGRPVERVTREKDLLGIPMQPGMQGKEQVLEVWYSVEQPASHWGVANAQLDPPTIADGSAVPRLYWQVCLPGHEHLLTEPAGFAAELDWQWRGLFWERQSTIAQRDLELWTGATEQPTLPQGVNTYLFSSFGTTPSLHVVKAPQRLLLALFSVAALCLGLALLYIERLRSPVALLVVSIVLLVAAMWAPEVTLFVGQAIVLGLVVALVSAFAWWLTAGRLERAAGASPSVVMSARPAESNSTQIPAPRSDRPSPSTTATSPLGIATVEPRP